MTVVAPRGENLVFLVGSPRSGTTWLSRLLGAHSEIAATQETELISRYCRAWYDAWQDQIPDDVRRWERHRHRGLPSVLTLDEFDDYVIGFARSVYDKVLALKPTAKVVIDKHPAYSLNVGLLRRMFPAAAVLDIVRDGRDVAASLLAASEGWGKDWAPGRIRLAAQTWRRCVEGAALAEDGSRYLRIKYEDLVQDGPSVLFDCLQFAGVKSDHDQCADIVRRFELRAGADRAEDSLVWSGEVVKRLGRAPGEPEGFFGSGATNNWRRTWNAWDRLTFAHVAGDLLRDLRYVADDQWTDAPLPLRALSAAVEHVVQVAPALGWRLHTWLGRRGIYVHLARVNRYE